VLCRHQHQMSAAMAIGANPEAVTIVASGYATASRIDQESIVATQLISTLVAS